MYKRLFAFCVIFVMIFSLMAANAAKLSDLDMSKIELVKESKIDVESVSVGAEFGNPPAGWTYQFVLGEQPKIAEADGNKYIASNGFWQMFHEPVEEKYYMFSVDVKVSGKQNFGIFARAGKEKFQYELNMSDFFEQDRSGEHDGLQALGGSGMYVRVEGKKVTLYIKLYDESQKCDINNKLYAFETNYDFSTGFHTITLADDGKNVYVAVDDEIIARVKFSDPKTYPIGEEQYYSKVVVYGGDGSELGTHDNALFAVNSVVAIGNRNSPTNFDNIILRTYKDKADNPQTSDSGVALFALTVAFGMAVVVFKEEGFCISPR
ncbi:MAG: hypothetical protein ACOX3J_12700 [Clostridia bacterium]